MTEDKTLKEKIERERQLRYYSHIEPTYAHKKTKEDIERINDPDTVGVGALLKLVLNNGDKYIIPGGKATESTPATILPIAYYTSYYDIKNETDLIEAMEKEIKDDTSGDVAFYYSKVLDTYKGDYQLFIKKDYLRHEQRREILRLALDHDNLEEIKDNITLDLLTYAYEKREPTDRERERWESLHITYRRDFLRVRFTLKDLILIYKAICDLKITLPESTQSPPALLEELNKIAPIREYRTRARAGEVDPIPHSDFLTLITNSAYDKALSLAKTPYKKAGLAPIQEDAKWDILEGRWKIDGVETDDILADEITNKKGEAIDIYRDTDFPLLQEFYSIFFRRFWDKNENKAPNEYEGDEIHNFFVPELLREISGSYNSKGGQIDEIINKINSFAGIAGVFWRENSPGKKRRYRKIFPLLILHKYDADSNLLQLSSPYFNYLLQELYDASIKKDKKGLPKKKKDGSPLIEATHSELIKKSILKERNKKAVVNVFLLVAQVEQAGSPSRTQKKEGEPRVVRRSIKTLIEENPELDRALEEALDTRRKNTLLKRTFEKTYELLKRETILYERYEDFTLDKAPIPTIQTLDECMIQITHNGKKLH